MQVHGHLIWLAVAGAILVGTAQLPGPAVPETAVHTTVAPASVDGVVDHVLTLEVVAFACDERSDGVCLGYGGMVPAAPIVAHVGDTFELTLVNRIAETLATLDVDLDGGTRDQLASAGVSFHTHGTVLAVTSDGVQAVPGTQMVDSYAPPGGSYTYVFEARYVGAWHFHDHIMGPDGAEGQHRGLYGTLLVLPRGESPGTVVDLHVLDGGVNNGHGVSDTVPAGERLDVVVVGLGNHWWTVQLTAPDGSTVGSVEVGPGVSFAITEDEAVAGTYTYEAVSGLTGATYTGVVVAQ